MKRGNGFTLVELLNVIAIIAVLAAILFPVFAKAKAAAKSTVCISNLNQIGIALTLYANDYDDEMPMSFAPANPNNIPCGIFYGWLDALIIPCTGQPTPTWNPQNAELFPYIKDPADMQCPMMVNDGNNFTGNGYAVNIELAMNCDVIVGQKCAVDSQIPEIPGPKFSQIQATSDTILMGDSIVLSPDWSTVLDLNPNGLTAVAYGLHNSFANLLWCDTHVKSKPPAPIPYNVYPYKPDLNEEETYYHAGAIWKSPPPASPAQYALEYGTPAIGPAAYYYLMAKPSS